MAANQVQQFALVPWTAPQQVATDRLRPLHVIAVCVAEALRRFLIVLVGTMFLPIAVFADYLTQVVVRQWPNLQRRQWHVSTLIAAMLVWSSLTIWWRSVTTRACDAYVRADKPTVTMKVCNDTLNAFEVNIKIDSVTFWTAMVAICKALLVIVAAVVIAATRVLLVLAALPVPILFLMVGVCLLVG